MSESSLPKLLRLDAVLAQTGVSRSTLYSLIAQGRFPRPVQLTASARAWPEREVCAWIYERIAGRDAGAGA